MKLNVVAPPEFQGFINYKDPLTETVSLVTGGDGTVAFIYTPPSIYGVYVPKSMVVGNRLPVPLPMPFWMVCDGMKCRIAHYIIFTDSPGGKRCARQFSCVLRRNITVQGRSYRGLGCARRAGRNVPIAVGNPSAGFRT